MCFMTFAAALADSIGMRPLLTREAQWCRPACALVAAWHGGQDRGKLRLHGV